MEVKRFIGFYKTRRTLNQLREKYHLTQNPSLPLRQKIGMYERRLIAEFCNSVFREDIRDQDLTRYYEHVIYCFKTFNKFEKMLDAFVVRSSNGVRSKSADGSILRRRGSFDKLIEFYNQYPYLDKLSYQEFKVRVDIGFPVEHSGCGLGKQQCSQLNLIPVLSKPIT